MQRGIRGFIVLLCSVPLIVAVTPLQAWAGCSQGQRTAGTCIDITVGDEDVTVERSEYDPGSPGSSVSTGSGSTWEPPPIRVEAELGSSECEIKIDGLCRGAAPAKNTDQGVSATPPSLPRFASDLEGFRPTSPSITVQPDGWTLPRLPTNLVARAQTHRESGELLGWPVEVRFRPVAFHWDYGDGAGFSTGQTGSTWGELAKRQFDTTNTSHVYRAPGSYRVALVVEYDVEIRFEDDEFKSLEGTVTARAREVVVDVLTVSPLVVGGN